MQRQNQQQTKMKKTKICKAIVCLCATIMTAACNNGKGGYSESDITVQKLELDSVTVENIELCSYTGYSGTCKDSLYFWDERLSDFYTISIDGELGKRRLGYGHSTQEIPIHPNGESYSDLSGELVTMGGTYDGYVYDGKVREFRMQPEGEKNSYTSSSIYSTWDYVIMRNDKSYMYFNVLSDIEEFGLNSSNKDYFAKAAIIMKVNLTDGKMTPIGHYPDFYVENQGKVKQLPYYYFDLDDDGGFFMTFQADSLIYHYDSDFKLLDTFGFKGRDMDTKYSNPGNNDKDFAKAIQTDQEHKGYYTWLERVGDYIFRSYQKSSKATTYGLQIYKGGTLIGDVDVPRGFKVAGKVGDYFVSHIVIDEEAQKLYFYKFKIDD